MEELLIRNNEGVGRREHGDKLVPVFSSSYVEGIVHK